MITVKGTMNPTVIKTIAGTFAVSGSNWVSVPNGTSLKNIKWVNTTPKKEKEINFWDVLGSSGNVYKVQWNGSFYSCTCPGYTYRRTCRHIKETSDSFVE